MVKSYRSASSGRYVTKAAATRQPSKTVGETRGGQPTDRSRSAVTGKFVSESYARRHPTTTVTES